MQTKEKSRKRLIYNLSVFGAIAGFWILYAINFPFFGLGLTSGFTLALLGMKLYDDRSSGISGYGERRDNIVIAEEYLEIKDVKIPYTELSNLVIYVNEYLGMPKGVYGIHHGGNNTIEFDHQGKSVSMNYVIKNKHDFHRVNALVNVIEKNPELKRNLRKI